MLFAIIFLIAFIVIAAFAFYLSRTIEHGEARFDTRNPHAETCTAHSDADEGDGMADKRGIHEAPM